MANKGETKCLKINRVHSVKGIEKTKRFLIARIFSKARMEEIARFIREDK